MHVPPDGAEPGHQLRADVVPLLQPKHLLHRLIEPRAQLRQPGGAAVAPEKLLGIAGVRSVAFSWHGSAERYSDTVAAAGMPPHRYVLQQRLARSKSLLADPALSISAVALRARFASQSHFTTAFRRLTSTTPARYRQGVRL